MGVTVDDLITKLRAKLDEIERIAQRAAGVESDWAYDRETFHVASASYSIAARKADGSPINDVDGEHIALHDPKAALEMVSALREILELHAAVRLPRDLNGPAGVCRLCSADRPYEYMGAEWPCATLRALVKGHRITVE